MTVAVTNSAHSDSIGMPVAEAARLLGISAPSVYRHLSDGSIPGIHIGGRVFVDRAALRVQLAAASGRELEDLPAPANDEENVTMATRKIEVEDLSEDEAAQVYGVTVAWVREQGRNGKLPGGSRMGDRYYIVDAARVSAVRHGQPAAEVFAAEYKFDRTHQSKDEQLVARIEAEQARHIAREKAQQAEEARQRAAARAEREERENKARKEAAEAGGVRYA